MNFVTIILLIDYKSSSSVKYDLDCGITSHSDFFKYIGKYLKKCKINDDVHYFALLF